MGTLLMETETKGNKYFLVIITLTILIIFIANYVFIFLFIGQFALEDF